MPVVELEDAAPQELTHILLGKTGKKTTNADFPYSHSDGSFIASSSSTSLGLSPKAEPLLLRAGHHGAAAVEPAEPIVEHMQSNISDVAESHTTMKDWARTFEELVRDRCDLEETVLREQRRSGDLIKQRDALQTDVMRLLEEREKTSSQSHRPGAAPLLDFAERQQDSKQDGKQHQTENNERQQARSALEAELEAVKETLRQETIAAKRLREDLEQKTAEACRLQRELEQARAQGQAESRASSEESRKLWREQDENHRSDKAAWGHERDSMQATIGHVVLMLQDTITTANQMRDTALRAKRNAAASISPHELAELASELAAMRERLACQYQLISPPGKQQQQQQQPPPQQQQYRSSRGSTTISHDASQEGPPDARLAATSEGKLALQQKLGRKTSQRVELERQFLTVRNTLRGSGAGRVVGPAPRNKPLATSATWGGLPNTSTMGPRVGEANRLPVLGGNGCSGSQLSGSFAVNHHAAAGEHPLDATASKWRVNFH